MTAGRLAELEAQAELLVRLEWMAAEAAGPRPRIGCGDTTRGLQIAIKLVIFMRSRVKRSEPLFVSQ